jgi:hypothetical protein
MQLDPPPTIAPVTSPKTGALTTDWTRWLLGLFGTVSAQATVLGTRINLTKQAASIGLTPFPTPALSGGLIRVSWYLRITTIDPVSSAINVTIGYTESHLALSIASTPLTGNTLSTVQTGTVLVMTDQGSAITYRTTYASNTPGTMQYRFAAVVEQV